MQLENWTRQQIVQQHDNRCRVNLSAGTIGFPAEPSRLNVVDEHRGLAWAKQNLPQSIKTVETIQKAELKDYFKTTGEIADGAEIMGGVERFYISTKNPVF